jgi:hypothetical protein
MWLRSKFSRVVILVNIEQTITDARNSHKYLQEAKTVLNKSCRRKCNETFYAECIFSLFALFWQKIKVGLYHLHAICASMNLTPRINFWMPYVYHGTGAHLSGVLHKSLPSVCVCMCIPLSLLGNGSVKCIPPFIVRSQRHIATDGQAISKSWPDIYYSLTVTDLLFWGALSDERTGLFLV